MTASTAIVQVESDPTMRGRVLALQAIVFLGSTPIGGPIVGALCDEFGARSGLVLGGFAALAAGGWGYLACRARARRELVTRDLDVTGEMAAPAT
jgi:MFS family permease